MTAEEKVEILKEAMYPKWGWKDLKRFNEIFREEDTDKQRKEKGK